MHIHVCNLKMAPYYRYSEYLQKIFGAKVRKVTLDAGFTCPNIDGTKGVGGCTYCNNESFSPGFALRRRQMRLAIREQAAQGMERLKTRYGETKFIAYFQAFTNTYAEMPALKEAYDQALEHPDVVGLAVGTRPDCVDEGKLDLLASYGQRLYVALEVGLETSHDRTLALVNRGHDFAAFDRAMRLAEKYKIHLGTHVILGLPGETSNDMLSTAERLAAYRLDTLKIHNLYIARGTPMEQDFREGKIQVFAFDAYIPLVCDFLERIAPRVAIERLTGNAPSPFLVAPDWCRDTPRVTRAVEEEFKRRETAQGCRFAAV